MKVLKKIVIRIIIFMLAMTFWPAVGVMAEESSEETGGEMEKSNMSGSGTEEDPFIITTVGELRKMSDNLAASYMLGNDIDLGTVTDWDPIGNTENEFTGTLDGAGHVIRNLKISRRGKIDEDSMTSEYCFIGLFGCIQNAVIRNLGIENAGYYVYWQDYEGESYDEIFSCLGGIAGKMYESTVENCYFIGTLVHRAGDYVLVRSGAITAFMDGNSAIKNCYTNAISAIKGNYGNIMIAGIAAWQVDSVIEKCYAAGMLLGKNSEVYNYVGGISASGEGGEVKDCVCLLSAFHEPEEYYDYYWDIISNFAGESNNYYFEPDSPLLSEPETFSDIGWDMSQVWKVENGYPQLRIFEQ